MEQKINKKDLTVEVMCPMCSTTSKVYVNREDYEAWKKGKLAQRAFPYLSVEDREILITHLCVKCQKTLECDE